MIYYKLMEALRKNEYFLTRDLVSEIQQAPGTACYRTLLEDHLFNRVHQVIYHVYKRHASLLNNEASKATLWTIYTELGKQRCREGFPLQEVIEAVLLIKRRVFQCMMERLLPEENYSMRRLIELCQNVGLFFDRMIQAIVAGYQEEDTAGLRQALPS